MPGNEDAERIYFIVQDQFITGPSGAIALNQLAIHNAMELYEVVDKKDCFEKVILVSRAVLKEERERNGNKNR